MEFWKRRFPELADKTAARSEAKGQGLGGARSKTHAGMKRRHAGLRSGGMKRLTGGSWSPRKRPKGFGADKKLRKKKLIFAEILRV